MIIEWFMSVAAGLWGFIGGLIPDWNLPAELVSPNGMLSQVFALGVGAGAFVDWAFCATLAAIPLAVWVIGLLWRGARMILSHFPFFGGNG